jgi:outer membrane protein OmpA-like peptidoglycan-associated protein
MSTTIPPFTVSILGVKYSISGTFGWRINPIRKKKEFHNGLDLRAASGTKVYTPLDGKVTSLVASGYGGGWGINVTITHDNGLQTFYAHLSKILVVKGQAVIAGQEIAEVGSTGLSTGPHLHFTVRKDGNPVDPKPLIQNQPLVVEAGNPTQDAIETVPEPETRKIIGVNEIKAAGIWQIVKLVVDKSVAHRQVIDTHIAFQQGSLMNYIKQVCQKEFVEFFTGTYGDKFYMMLRKPPFDLEGWLELNTFAISENMVYGDTLGANTGEVYSWYQLVPKGSYLYDESVTVQYLPAVFLPEYAEIWGSKPYVVTTNYLYFIKNGTNDYREAKERAEADMKFLILTNAYLPFTRKGTITIKHDRRIRRGMKILYLPTNEEFFVDSVTQTYAMTDSGPERMTVLGVSRGMVRDFIVGKTINGKKYSYFNLIDFGGDKSKPDFKEHDFTIEKNYELYFDSGSEYVIDTTKTPLNAETQALQDEYPTKRSEIEIISIKAIDSMANDLFNYKGLSFIIEVHTDNVETTDFIGLSEKRGQDVLSLVQYFYNEKNGSKEDISNRIKIVPMGEQDALSDNVTTLGKANNRKAVVKTNKVATTSKNRETFGIGDFWKVDKEVFNFFMKNKQLIDYIKHE